MLQGTLEQQSESNLKKLPHNDCSLPAIPKKQNVFAINNNNDEAAQLVGIVCIGSQLGQTSPSRAKFVNQFLSALDREMHPPPFKTHPISTNFIKNAPPAWCYQDLLPLNHNG